LAHLWLLDMCCAAYNYSYLLTYLLTYLRLPVMGLVSSGLPASFLYAHNSKKILSSRLSPPVACYRNS